MERFYKVIFKCFLFSSFSLFTNATKAQSLILGNEQTKIEVGLNIGPSFFMGDLGGHRGKGKRFLKDLNLPITQMMAGAFVAVYPNEWIGFRIAAQAGSVQGEDQLITSKGEDELYRKQRNLDFKSNIAEVYIATEIYPLMLLNKNNPEYAPRLKPYGVAGIGAYHFNPQGSLTDDDGNKTWHSLKPLHTEGQGFPEYPDRKEYALTQINIPLGLGFKYHISDRVNISLEYLLRILFTDYMDDVSKDYIDPALFDKYLSPADAIVARQISDKVFAIVNPGLTRNSPGSQRGNPKQNDSYFTAFLKFGIRLGKISENRYGSNSSYSSVSRCPRL